MSTESRHTRGRLGKLFGKGSVAALLLPVFLIGGTAWADMYTAFGVGKISCGRWLDAQKTDREGRWQTEQWVSGYFTAYGRWAVHGPERASLPDAYGAIAWIDNYCQEHPLERVAEAAEQLIFAIRAE